MGGNESGATVAPAQAEMVLARLEDPQAATARHQLLERGEQIADNRNGGWAELRTSLVSTEADVGQAASQLSTLIPALARATPAVHRVIDADVQLGLDLAVLNSFGRRIPSR